MTQDARRRAVEQWLVAASAEAELRRDVDFRRFLGLLSDGPEELSTPTRRRLSAASTAEHSLLSAEGEPGVMVSSAHLSTLEVR